MKIFLPWPTSLEKTSDVPENMYSVWPHSLQSSSSQNGSGMPRKLWDEGELPTTHHIPWVPCWRALHDKAVFHLPAGSTLQAVHLVLRMQLALVPASLQSYHSFSLSSHVAPQQNMWAEVQDQVQQAMSNITCLNWTFLWYSFKVLVSVM